MFEVKLAAHVHVHVHVHVCMCCVQYACVHVWCAVALLCLCMLHVHIACVVLVHVHVHIMHVCMCCCIAVLVHVACAHVLSHHCQFRQSDYQKTNHHCVTKEEGTLKQHNNSVDRNISKRIDTAMSNLKNSKLIKLLHPIASPLPIKQTASSSNCLITLPSPHGLLQEVAQPLCMQSNILAYCYWGGWSKWPRAGHLFPPI